MRRIACSLPVAMPFPLVSSKLFMVTNQLACDTLPAALPDVLCWSAGRYMNRKYLLSAGSSPWDFFLPTQHLRDFSRGMGGQGACGRITSG